MSDKTSEAAHTVAKKSGLEEKSTGEKINSLSNAAHKVKRAVGMED